MKLCVIFLFILSAISNAKMTNSNGPTNLTFSNLKAESNLKYDVEDGVLQVHPFKKYQPTWSDLDSRPLPEWYDRAKVGIFIHWGVYSVPGFGSEWFWENWRYKKLESHVEYMKKNYKPGFTYQDFAPMFTAEYFEPAKWAKLFANAGAKYVVLTSKHHDGYTLFPSRRSFSWNSVDVGPKRDLVGDLADAIRKEGLVFGVYHSLYEWFNPIYLEDKQKLFLTRNYADQKLWPDLKQLINDYKPDVLWSDGDWDCLDTYWKSREFLAWLYNESPVKDNIVVNDRWGIGSYCKHGDFYNCQDKYNPGVLQSHKWENAFTVDAESWGYRKRIDIASIITMDKLLNETVTTVSCGGNVLINVGPTSEGTIIPIFQERLLQLGEWLKINGEAIYDTSPWFYQKDSLDNSTWYTCNKTTYNATHPTAVPSDKDVVTAVYAITLKWPKDNVLRLKDITSYSNYEKLELLGNKGAALSRKTVNNITMITLPDRSKVTGQNAWVLKFSPMANTEESIQ